MIRSNQEWKKWKAFILKRQTVKKQLSESARWNSSSEDFEKILRKTDKAVILFAKFEASTYISSKRGFHHLSFPGRTATLQSISRRLLLAVSSINPLSANFTKWSNTLNQFVGKLPTNCLSVFDHFVVLALKGLR